MQTDAADAPNSQQMPHHWINKSQINKKKTNRISNTFCSKMPVKKRGKTKRHKRGKVQNTGKHGEERVKGKKGST